MIMRVGASDGQGVFTLGMGGPMGESNEVEAFCGNFYRAIRNYKLTTAKLISAPLLASGPGDAKKYDLSLGALSSTTCCGLSSFPCPPTLTRYAISTRTN